MTDRTEQRDAAPGVAEETVRRAAGASVLSRLRDRDHTRGSLLTSLLTLAVPLLGSSLLGGVLYQLGDLKLVSGLGASATTAVRATPRSTARNRMTATMSSISCRRSKSVGSISTSPDSIFE